MSKLNNRYWLEFEHFSIKNKSHILSQIPYPDSNSRTRLFPESKTFCNKPTPLYTNQYPELFITYEEGFNMHIGNPLQLLEVEQYTKLSTQLNSRKLVHTQKKLFLPALNSSNNFATFEYEAHIFTKTDYSIIRVFKTMSVAKLKFLHTVCEVERTQLMTIIAMSVRIYNLLVFSKPKIVVIFYLLKVLLPGSLIVLTTSLWLYDCPHRFIHS